MTVTVGAGAIGAVYLGADPADAVYLGTDLVWSATPAGPPQPPAGMSAWYDVASLAGLADGAPVTSWVDKSGNGNDLTLNGSGVTWDATLQRVKFTGSGRLLKTSFTGMPSAAYTFIGNGRSTGGAAGVILSTRSTAGMWARYTSTTNVQFNDVKHGSVGVTVAAAEHVLWMRWPGTGNPDVGVDTNTAAATISGVSDYLPGVDLALGSFPPSAGGTSTLTGTIGSVLIYPTALNPTDLATAIAAVA